MKKKILMALALIGCAVVLVAGTIAGTVAYLTSTSGTLKNTFTVGNVSITMDEAKVNVYGEQDGAIRVSGSADDAVANTYKLIPGHTYVKDPTIHVAAGSEACYLFVKVENGISAIEATGATIEAQMTANGWKSLANDIWYKEAAVDARNAAQDVAVFSTFTLATDADLDGDPDYSAAVVKVTAYAVQADGFTTATAAWGATFGAPANPES